MPQTSVSIKQTVSFAGMLGDSSMLKDAWSVINANTSAEIPFGVMCMRGTNDDDAKSLAATSDKLIGVAVHAHSFNKDNELGTTGIKVGVIFSVLRRGRIWVPVEEAVTPASSVLVRAVADTNEVAGAFRDTADSSDCIDISQMARYLTSTSGSGLALVEIDLVNFGADVAD